MLVTQFQLAASAAVGSTATVESACFDPSVLPWTDWVMPGTWFKLLNLNPMTGGFSMLFKVKPNKSALIHGHLAAVKGFILEGGLIMFAVIHGPLCGYHADGTIAGIVDAAMMYEIAVAAGAAGHIE